MSTLLTIVHVITCLFLMLTVLLQSGKGGGMGGAFGGGNAATVFGGGGASNFLKRLTAIGGVVFMATSMVLAFIASHNSADELEKFGKEQEELAAQKEEAKEAVLGSGAGSAQGAQGSGMVILGSGAAPTPSSQTPPSMAPAGSDATDGVVPVAPTPAPTTTGSAAVAPTAPAAGSAAKPAAPAVTPAKPAAPAEKPAAPAPAPAPIVTHDSADQKPAATAPAPSGTP